MLKIQIISKVADPPNNARREHYVAPVREQWWPSKIVSYSSVASNKWPEYSPVAINTLPATIREVDNSLVVEENGLPLAENKQRPRNP